MTSWLLTIFSTLNYKTIIILMAVESSLIPFPSEVVMPPAGYLASQGQLDLKLAIVCGVIGSLLGALFNYGLAATLGRVLLESFVNSRWGKLLLLSQKKLNQSEAYFNRYGRAATFWGRLVPAVRQLISLPAGLSRMPLASFVIFTALGSAVWMTILTLAGYYFGANQTAIAGYYHYAQKITWLVLVLLFGWLIIYLFNKKKRRRL